MTLLGVTQQSRLQWSCLWSLPLSTLPGLSWDPGGPTMAPLRCPVVGGAAGWGPSALLLMAFPAGRSVRLPGRTPCQEGKSEFANIYEPLHVSLLLMPPWTKPMAWWVQIQCWQGLPTSMATRSATGRTYRGLPQAPEECFPHMQNCQPPARTPNSRPTTGSGWKFMILLAASGSRVREDVQLQLLLIQKPMT